jgi:hypothetical protein
MKNDSCIDSKSFAGETPALPVHENGIIGFDVSLRNADLNSKKNQRTLSLKVYKITLKGGEQWPSADIRSCSASDHQARLSA